MKFKYPDLVTNILKHILILYITVQLYSHIQFLNIHILLNIPKTSSLIFSAWFRPLPDLWILGGVPAGLLGLGDRPGQGVELWSEEDGII